MLKTKTFRNTNGIKRMVIHYKDNEKHNKSGPALIAYHNDGSVNFEEYWLYGFKIQVSSNEEFQKNIVSKLNIEIETSIQEEVIIRGMI